MGARDEPAALASKTASHMSLLGIGAALAAAVPGLIDYMFAMPPKSSAKKRATSHMIANVSALGLFALARARRRPHDDRPAAWSLAAELAGMSLMTAAGWMGGTLVYRNQIGVDHRYANAGKYRIEPARASLAIRSMRRRRTSFRSVR